MESAGKKLRTRRDIGKDIERCLDDLKITHDSRYHVAVLRLVQVPPYACAVIFSEMYRYQ